MKKYIFGVFAIALAVGFSSFGVKKAPLRFEYQPSVYSQADVQDVSHYTTASTILCGDQLDRACQIIVDEANTMNNGTELDPNKVAIVAQDGDANNQWGIQAVSVTTGSASFQNKD